MLNKLSFGITLLIFVVMLGVLYVDWMQTKMLSSENSDSLLYDIPTLAFLQEVSPVERVKTEQKQLNINAERYQYLSDIYSGLNLTQNEQLGTYDYNPAVDVKQHIILKPTIYDYVSGIQDQK